MDVSLVADKVEGGNFVVAFQRPFGTGDDDPATVVAAHDIHCYSHRKRENAELSRANMLKVQPAFTVRTWRPL